MPGNKNKSKNATCLCIFQAVRIKAVCKAMYLHLKDDSDTSNNSHDVVVLTDKEEDGHDEDKLLQ